MSYRPSPVDRIGYGFDPERIQTTLCHDLSACKQCHTDITLKDVETVQRDPNRVVDWVKITRQVIDEVYGYPFVLNTIIFFRGLAHRH
jgi:hypothetical protein